MHKYIHTNIHTYRLSTLLQTTRGLWVYIHTHAHSTYIHTSIHTYIHTYRSSTLLQSTHTAHTYIHTYIHTHIQVKHFASEHAHNTYIYTYIHTYIHTGQALCFRARLASGRCCIYIYIYIYIYTHTHIHTYIHTCRSSTLLQSTLGFWKVWQFRLGL